MAAGAGGFGVASRHHAVPTTGKNRIDFGRRGGWLWRYNLLPPKCLPETARTQISENATAKQKDAVWGPLASISTHYTNTHVNVNINMYLFLLTLILYVFHTILSWRPSVRMNREFNGHVVSFLSISLSLG